MTTNTPENTTFAEKLDGELTQILPSPKPQGLIIAEKVSLEDYMNIYAAHFCEWVEGYVIQMSPSTLKHQSLLSYLVSLFEAYFEINDIGQVIIQPFVMKLPAFPNRRREPDLFIVLHTNAGELKETYMDGAADICIEIVSEGSVERDYGDKFVEYEKGGVSEYWILDPIRQDTRFFRLNDKGLYESQTLDADGYYHSLALPGLRLHVPSLWDDKLPGPSAIVAAVRQMLGDPDDNEQHT